MFYAILNKNSFVRQYLAEISVEKSQMSKIVPKWDKISAKLYKSKLRTKLIHSSISAKGWKPCLGCSKLLLLTKNGKSVHTLPNSDHSASTHEPRGTNAVPTPVRCPAPKPSYTRIRLDSIYCPAECQFFPRCQNLIWPVYLLILGYKKYVSQLHNYCVI